MAGQEIRIERVAVIGAGNMGGGVAQKVATEGFPVVLVDVDAAAVDRGMARIRATLDEAVERTIFDRARADAILARVEGSPDLGGARDADLIIEAVFENRALKEDLFRRLDGIVAPDAILATNTSSLSVTGLAAVTKRPERVVGLHFFFHPAKNRLVEVVPGEATSGAVRTASWRFAERIGKTPIASQDRPGFVVNRYFVPWLVEAVRMMEEGVADPATVDAAAREAFRIGMGPFELMNLTGIPIALHAASTLAEGLGPFYAPPRRLAEQVEAGTPWSLEGEPDHDRFEAVRRRLTAVVLHVAATLVEEGVGTIEDADIGARVGLRWPKGPFEMANRLGLPTAAAWVEEEVGRRYDLPLPRLLAERREDGPPFRFRLVQREDTDGIATLTIARPDAMNALDEDVIAQLEAAWEDVAADPTVRAVVLAGAGKAFVAGADIRWFVKQIEADAIDRIRTFTARGQALWQRIDESPKPVTVRLHGLSLGGGSELALCADRIVATPSGSLGFPETGIGIYPGLGGTQRLARRIGRGLARYFIYTGAPIDARTGEALGLVEVVSPDELPHRLAVVPPRHVYADRPPVAPPALAKAAAFFERWTVEDILEGRAETGGDPEAERWVKRTRAKAPIALRIAERLIDRGLAVSLPEGLALELASLEEIFRTRDAYTGLTSLGRGRPSFSGH